MIYLLGTKDAVYESKKFLKNNPDLVVLKRETFVYLIHKIEDRIKDDENKIANFMRENGLKPYGPKSK